MELREQTKKATIAIITPTEDEMLDTILRSCNADLLILDGISGNIEEWESSPDLVIFDSRFLSTWQDHWTRFKNIEVYEDIPCICILEQELPVDEKILQIRKGLFGYALADDTSAITILATTALTQGKLIKENQLKSNELNRLLSTNYLVQDAKNDQLEKTKERLQNLTSYATPEIEKTLKAIIKEIESNLKKEYQYQLFKVHFEEVHPLFYNKLLSINPKLTDNNLKLLAFLKMGFHNNEIAFLLNISLAAVKKNNQRLKQKINIAPDASLREFLFRLDG